MTPLIRREFIVAVSSEAVWRHLSRIARWPSWARHIQKIDLDPPGEFGPRTTGVIHLTNGMKPVFRVTEFNPPRNWLWVGAFLWLTVFYDHLFEPLGENRTKVTFVIAAKGFGASVLGRPFAWLYRRTLEKAIPLLIAEMEAARDQEASKVGAES